VTRRYTATPCQLPVAARAHAVHFSRRCPPAVAGTVAAPALAQSQTPARTEAITSDALAVAQQIVGVELPAAEREIARVLVARNRDNIEQLRRVAIPSNTEPAFSFRPPRPPDHKHKRAPDYGQVALAEQREILGRAGISSDIARAAGVGAGHSVEERQQFVARKPVFEAAVEVYRNAGATLIPIKRPDLPAAAIDALLNAKAGAMFDETHTIRRH
jgi:hypothetical protein